MLLRGEHLDLNYGVRQLLDDVTLYLNPGDKVGIIGLNGCGKSTLLRILAGDLEPDSGTVAVDPNVQVSRLAQEPELCGTMTVLEAVFAAAPAGYRELAEYEARTMLNRLGLTDHDRIVGTLSGGERKRTALAAALIQPADVLILDEPTNHLDNEMAAWLEQFLIRFSGAVVMITHDRYFLQRVSTRIGELYQGSLYLYEANYARYLELKLQRLEYAQATERKRQAVLRREAAWISRGARARTTKAKGRIEAYEELLDREAPVEEDAARIVGGASRLGRQTIELSHVSKAFDGRVILRDFSWSLLRRDRIGIVGRNGAGKSTLLSLISGALAPDSGTARIGATVKLGCFLQLNTALDPDQTVLDYVNEQGTSLQTAEGVLTAARMLEYFLFPSQTHYRRIGELSGGERRRLYLLGVLMTAPNVLLLDEPTNDLDIETLGLLEDYLETFPGAVIAVSHDRYFLDRTAQTILEVRGDGEVRAYPGSYADYAARRAGEEAGREKILPAAGSEKRAPEAAGTTGAERPKKLKFTFREQREYETIEGDIAALEERAGVLAGEIDAAGADYVRLQALMEEQTALEAALEEKLERWVYLSELADRIAGQG